MVDYEREWNEIEAEERRVRIELDQALPGDRLLGPATSSQQPSPLPEIPFSWAWCCCADGWMAH